jgi:hypothetical protein
MSSLLGKIMGSSPASVKKESKTEEVIPKLENINNNSNVIPINNSIVDVDSEEYKEFQAYLKFKKGITIPNVQEQPTGVLNSSSSNDVVVRSSYAQPKAAVDDKVQLPEFSKFANKSISTDTFVKWKRVVLDAIDGSPRYRPLLQEAEEGWMDFQRANKKYELENIEMYYLDAHRQLWSLISACFDSDIITSIAEELKLEALEESLPMILGFKYCKDYDFYKDVRKLLDRLSKRYEVKSGWDICNSLKQFLQLEFRADGNPMGYIELFMLNYRKILLLRPDFKIPDDMLAYLMLSQLPAECFTVKSQFLDVDTKPSLAKVREILISWWQSHKGNVANKTIQRGKSNDKQMDRVKANPASASINDQYKQREGRSPIICYNCKQPGHIARDCRSKEGVAANYNSNNNNNNNNNNNISNNDTDNTKTELATIEIECPVDESNETEPDVYAAISAHSRSQTNKIHIDSCASLHFACRKDLLEDIGNAPPVYVSTLFGGKKVDQVGTLELNKEIRLPNVRYIPNSMFNLLSVSQVVKKGYQALFTNDGAFILKANTIPSRYYTNMANQILVGEHEGGVFTYKIQGAKDINTTKGEFVYKPSRIDENSHNNNNRTLENEDNKEEKKEPATKPLPSRIPKLVNKGVSVSQENNSNNIPTVKGGVTIVRVNDETDEETIPVHVACNSISTQTDDDDYINSDQFSLIHSRLAHLGIKGMKLTNEHYNLGISKEELDKHIKSKCNICMSSKAVRTSIGKLTANPSRKAIAIMDCWHIDLIGPMSEVINGERIHLPSVSGNVYMLVIVDEYSRYVMVKCINQKSDATQEIINIIKQQQVATRLTLKRIHTDGGKEFINKTLKEFLINQGTELTYTTTDTPQLNGIVERMNRTLTIMVTCMLKQGNIPSGLWNYAYVYAAYIYNRICQPSIDGRIPMKIMFPYEQINIDNIHVFGCNTHVMINEKKRGKLQSRTEVGIFVGYCREQHAFKILLPDTMMVRISRDVTFVENEFSTVNSARDRIKGLAEKLSTVKDKEYEVESITEHKVEDKINYYLIHWKGYINPTWEKGSKLTGCKKLLQEFKEKQQLEQQALITTDDSSIDIDRGANYPIPQNYQEALRHPDKDKWKEAIQAELDSLASFNTFTPCKLPGDKKTIDTRWVFVVKRNEYNKIIKWKARLVARGFQQKFGIDYNETFSPTVKFKSIKTLLSIAATLDLEIKQLDFNTAFLHAELTDDVYVKTPEGYYNKPGMVLKLNKALYGLKQASREWWLEIDKFLKTLDYESSPLDECLYVKYINNKPIYLALYVDDTIAIYDNSVENIWLNDKKLLGEKFSIKDIGDCEWILNMSLVRDRKNRKITLSQEAYIDTILELNNMTDCKPVRNPHWQNDITVCPDNMIPVLLNEEEHHTYRSLVGSMLYAANITRVDIAYIIGVLARYTHKPYNYHLIAAKHVLKYLAGSKDKKLVFGPNYNNKNSNDKFNIVMYSDSNWANEKEDRISTGGWLLTVNDSPISWQSKKQKKDKNISLIALSSTESEYYALTEAVKESVFIRQWFDFYCKQVINIVIKVKSDNQGAIQIADHSTNHNRTKHIDIKHFYIRSIIKESNGMIKIGFIRTKEQLADILTKATGTQVFNYLTSKLLVS